MEKHMETEIAAINQQSFKDKIKSYTKHPGSFLLLLACRSSADCGCPGISGGLYFNPRYPVFKNIAVCMDL